MRSDLLARNLHALGRVVRQTGQNPVMAVIRPGPEPRILFLDDRHAPPIATAIPEPGPYGRLRWRLSIDTRHADILVPTDMSFRHALEDLNRHPTPTFVPVRPDIA